MFSNSLEKHEGGELEEFQNKQNYKLYKLVCVLLWSKVQFTIITLKEKRI